jgi:hypothetical protein
MDYNLAFNPGRKEGNCTADEVLLAHDLRTQPLNTIGGIMELKLGAELQGMLRTMIKNDPVGLITASFFLGEKLAKQANTDPSQTLLAVASGDLTLHDTGAEIRKRFPDASTNLEAILNENQKVERIVAHLICGRMSGQQ